MSDSASEIIGSCFLSSMLSVNMYDDLIKNFSVICGLAILSSSRNWSLLDLMML